MIPTSLSVSVIIPVRNGQSYIAEALRSVVAQTLAPLEIIVVDDGSTDDSARIAERTSSLVRVFSQPPLGAPAARNRGVQETQGDLLAFLDADDEWTQDKLRLQVLSLQENPRLDAVYAMVDHFLSPELDQDRRKKLYCPDKPMPAPIATTFCIRKESFHRVGFFKTDLQVGEFVDWYAKAMELPIQVFMIPLVLAKRRIHENNLSLRHRDSRDDFARIIKASLDRRREKGIL